MAHTQRPLVTIGIPTYQRPELLRRALSCVARQDYPNIELIVADNCTPGTLVAEIVETFRPKIESLVFIRRPRNIGALRNFSGLLEAANGKYFMWLADDDEISANYVSCLVELLEAHPEASSAAGHWIAMQDAHAGKPMPTSSFPQKLALARALRFIWKANDSFFYALHRTSVIRSASFPGYWWPNTGVLLNWGYVFLLDLVLRGPILLPTDTSVQFISHYYTSKSYHATHNVGVMGIFRYVMRRLNVHYLYLRKTVGTLGVRAALPALLVSVAALCRELCPYFTGLALNRSRRIWSNLVRG